MSYVLARLSSSTNISAINLFRMLTAYVLWTKVVLLRVTWVLGSSPAPPTAAWNLLKNLESRYVRGVFQFYPENINISARVIKRRKSNKITHKGECIFNKNCLIIIFLYALIMLLLKFNIILFVILKPNGQLHTLTQLQLSLEIWRIYFLNFLRS